MLRRFAPALFLALLFGSCASSGHQSARSGEAWLAHDVYFDLKDNSAGAAEEFVAVCWEQLSSIEGIRFFASGTRVTELDRPVNDLEFDVSVHIFFESKAAHDAYQTDPKHLALIEAHSASWASVRVFDSIVKAGSPK